MLKIRLSLIFSESSFAKGQRLLEEIRTIPPLDIAGVRILSLGLPAEIDGKCRVHWTQTISMATCPVCGASGWELGMRWLPKFNHNPPEILQFGASNLHAEGGVFRWLKKGCCYRDFKCHDARGDTNKALKKQRADEMVEDFRAKMGLTVDKLMSGQAAGGTSTTGTVVRSAMDRPELLSEVLHIFPVEELEDWMVFFQAFNCGLALDPQEIYKLQQQMLNRFYGSERKWHRFSVYPHLMLHHGHKFVEFFPVPPGLLSEQGSEAKNKVFRQDRQYHARQTDPVSNILDVALRSHRRAEPLTNAFLSRPKRHRELHPRVVKLLANPEAGDILPLPAGPYEEEDAPEEGLEPTTEDQVTDVNGAGDAMDVDN